MSMHLYYTKGNEWFIAETIQIAHSMAVDWLKKTCGLNDEDIKEQCGTYDSLTRWPDSKELTITDEDTDAGAPGEKVTKTPEQWAKENGRGFWFAGEP